MLRETIIKFLPGAVFDNSRISNDVPLATESKFYKLFPHVGLYFLSDEKFSGYLIVYSSRKFYFFAIYLLILIVGERA